MARVKRGVSHLKRRKKLLAKTKGFKWGRKKLIKLAKTAAIKAGAHAYVDRRKKKRTARALWQIKISAFAKANGTSYSKLISALKNAKIELDRKILADLAVNQGELLKKLIEEIKK